MVSYDLRIQIANSLGECIKFLKAKERAGTIDDEERIQLVELFSDLEIAGFSWEDDEPDAQLTDIRATKLVVLDGD